MSLWLTLDDVLDRYFTNEAGHRIICRSTLTKLLLAGEIPYTRLGTKRNYYITQSAIEKFIRDHCANENTQITA